MRNFSTKPIGPAIARRVCLGSLLAAAGLLATGCLGLGEAQGISRDVNEIKLELNRLEVQQSESLRRIEFALAQIEQNQDKQNRALTSSTDDLETQLSQIRAELRKVSGATLEMQAAQTQALISEPSEEGKLHLKAQNAYSNGDYEQAIISFSQFLANFGASERAPEAAYSLAQCYFRIEDFERSRQAFGNIVVQYPASRIVPESLHARALCEIKLDLKTEARATLEKLRLLYSDYRPEPIEDILKGLE